MKSLSITLVIVLATLAPSWFGDDSWKADAFVGRYGGEHRKTSQGSQLRPGSCTIPSIVSSSTSLRSNNMDDFVNNIKNFFGGGGESSGSSGGDGTTNNESSTPTSDDDDEDGDDDLPAGTTLIATIPVRSIKPDGLRLFLMFYCMGMQNTPDRNAWRADQPSTEEYLVEMFFHHQTAMLTVELKEQEILIYRTGSTPSTNYVMQESVIVEGILDELQQCATPPDGDDIAEEDRLLIPEPADAIETAREALAFG